MSGPHLEEPLIFAIASRDRVKTAKCLAGIRFNLLFLRRANGGVMTAVSKGAGLFSTMPKQCSDIIRTRVTVESSSQAMTGRGVNSTLFWDAAYCHGAFLAVIR